MSKAFAHNYIPQSFVSECLPNYKKVAINFFLKFFMSNNIFM